MPKNGFPLAINSRKATSKFRARILLIASPNAPTPGSEIRSNLVKFDTSKFSDTNLGASNLFTHNGVSKIKIPHVGWNELKFAKQTKINANLNDEIYLYFVHSYHVLCDDSVVLGRTNYGYEFVSAVAKDNVFGFQAHPEKSHENGLKIIKNFMEL